MAGISFNFFSFCGDFCIVRNFVSQSAKNISPAEMRAKKRKRKSSAYAELSRHPWVEILLIMLFVGHMTPVAMNSIPILFHFIYGWMYGRDQIDVIYGYYAPLYRYSKSPRDMWYRLSSLFFSVRSALFKEFYVKNMRKGGVLKPVYPCGIWFMNLWEEGRIN